MIRGVENTYDIRLFEGLGNQRSSKFLSPSDYGGLAYAIFIIYTIIQSKYYPKNFKRSWHQKLVLI